MIGRWRLRGSCEYGDDEAMRAAGARACAAQAGSWFGMGWAPMRSGDAGEVRVRASSDQDVQDLVCDTLRAHIAHEP